MTPFIKKKKTSARHSRLRIFLCSSSSAVGLWLKRLVREEEDEKINKNKELLMLANATRSTFYAIFHGFYLCDIASSRGTGSVGLFLSELSPNNQLCCFDRQLPARLQY